MRNPFKRIGNRRTTPGGEPYGYAGSSRSILGPNKLKILSGIVTFIVTLLDIVFFMQQIRVPLPDPLVRNPISRQCMLPSMITVMLWGSAVLFFIRYYTVIC